MTRETYLIAAFFVSSTGLTIYFAFSSESVSDFFLGGLFFVAVALVMLEALGRRAIIIAALLILLVIAASLILLYLEMQPYGEFMDWWDQAGA